MGLNESPSEKEGKFEVSEVLEDAIMTSLNESPSEKEGKSRGFLFYRRADIGLNESPSEKEGKLPF